MHLGIVRLQAVKDRSRACDPAVRGVVLTTSRLARIPTRAAIGVVGVNRHPRVAVSHRREQC